MMMNTFTGEMFTELQLCLWPHASWCWGQDPVVTKSGLVLPSRGSQIVTTQSDEDSDLKEARGTTVPTSQGGGRD